MSKIKKISGHAAGLGIASLVALAGWNMPSYAQDAAATEKADPKAAPAKKPAAPPGMQGAAEKKGPPAGVRTAPGTGAGEKPVQTLGGPSAKDGARDKGAMGSTATPHGPARAMPKGSEAGDEKKPKGRPTVSRDEAIDHYRDAQKKLAQVPDPVDPKSDAAGEARKARREAMRELRRARDEILRSHNEARRAFQKRNPEEVEELRKQVSKHTAELRKDRKDRAQQAREEIAKVVGENPLHPSVREELRNHAWRIARLNQLIYLAELDKKPELKERAQKLVEKENASHQERLKSLLSKPEVKNYKPVENKNAVSKKAAVGTGTLPAGHPPVPAQPAQKAQPAGENP